MNIKNIFFKVIIILCYLFAFSSQAADILLKVDRTQIELHETFKLSFKAEETPDDDPDFSPLKKDFKILNESTSHNVIIVNGKYSRSTTWTLSLTAKRKGTLTIPAINFGKDSSESYQIVIKEPKKSSGKLGKTDEPVISELVISDEKAYPQQQIIVTQRLLSSRNITAYEFSPLQYLGVEVIEEALGEVKQYQTKYNGISYLVLEKNTAIYPQEAGKLLIEPSVVGARITIEGTRRNGTFDPFQSSSRTIRRSSKEKSIVINPIPAEFKSKHWLVAKEVQLVEEFPEGDTFKVGEPITRTLLLLADGQNSSQLPEFVDTPMDGLKQYPDKPLLKNNVSGSGITGVQQIKIAIIPSAAGTYTLPTVSVPWWNTKTNTMEVARIYPRTFTVIDEHVTGSTPTTPITTEQKAVIKSINENMSTTAGSPVIAQTNDSLPWKIATLFLTICLLITLQLLLKRKGLEVDINTVAPDKAPSDKQALKNIKQACQNNNARQVKDALIEWGQAIFNNNIHSLGDLEHKVDNELAEKIQTLNTFLYRNNEDNWVCGELYSFCNKYTKNIKNIKKSRINKESLEQLYK